MDNNDTQNQALEQGQEAQIELETLDTEGLESAVVIDETQEAKPKVSGKVVLKSGIWYTVSTFLFRSVAFFTTPIIVRVLSKTQYGMFNNMQSWLGFVMIFVGLGLSSTIIRAKLDYKEHIDSYALSVLALETLATTVTFGIFWLFKGPISAYTGVPVQFFPVAYFYVLFNQAYNVFITRERAHYRYKLYSLLSGLMIVFYSLFTVFLVLNMEDKLKAIVYGNYIPYIVVGAILYFLVAKDGKSIKLEHFKYGLMLGLPLLPHLFSMVLLSSADRIMITKMIGPADTALYSLSSVVPNIVSVLLNAMNEAWAPWFLDTLDAHDEKSADRLSIIYYLIFLSLVFGVMLVAPEVVFILGGKKYLPGIYIVPALIVGCIFQFAYSMYVQVEFFEKKMRTVSIATGVAAAVNIGLNLVLIPIVGYKAAAYTTLAAYAVLFFMHYRKACVLGYKDVFNRKVIIGTLIGSCALIPVVTFLYYHPIPRYILTVIYGAGVLYFLYKQKDVIKKFLKKK